MMRRKQNDMMRRNKNEMISSIIIQYRLNEEVEEGK
jgi:hypothetical protein